MSAAPDRRQESARQQTRRPHVRVSSITFLDPHGQTVTTAPDLDVGAQFGPAGAIRKIPHARGIHHTPGSYYSVTDGTLLDYESWLEARWLQLLDHDPAIRAIYTQPLMIRGIDEHGPLTHHVDIFARAASGTGLLIEVKAATRRMRPDAVRRSCLAHAAAQELGWTFYLVSDPPAQRARNVAWLAGYRRLHAGQHLIDPILQLARHRVRLRDLWASSSEPLLAKSVTFHLLWTHQLTIDLDTRMTDQSLVWRSP